MATLGKTQKTQKMRELPVKGGAVWWHLKLEEAKKKTKKILDQVPKADRNQG